METHTPTPTFDPAEIFAFLTERVCGVVGLVGPQARPDGAADGADLAPDQAPGRTVRKARRAVSRRRGGIVSRPLRFRNVIRLSPRSALHLAERAQCRDRAAIGELP